VSAWGVNHRPVIQRTPVVLVCEECGYEGCKAKQIESAYWWARLTCPSCGHIRMIGARLAAPSYTLVQSREDIDDLPEAELLDRLDRLRPHNPLEEES